MSRKKNETEQPRVLPLNKMVENRDRHRQKAKEMIDQLKLEEAQRELAEAVYWQRQMRER